MAELSLPTGPELKAIPRFAAGAFVARCARRVQPIFETRIPKPSSNQTQTINDAINFAERFASGGLLSDFSDQLGELLENTIGDLDSARAHVNSPKAVQNAPIAAMLAFQSVAGQEISIDAARLAAIRAADAYAPEVAMAKSKITEAIRADYELLRHASQAENWTDDTPVPPEFFGPMWPDGVPEGWPEVAKPKPDPTQTLELRIALPPTPDAPEAREVLRAQIVNLLTTANTVHLASGGSGLEIAGAKVYAKSGVPQGADA
ncbi:MAG: hypothetical protein ACIAQU_01465 [Phycisphaerales bacterium JB064]